MSGTAEQVVQARDVFGNITYAGSDGSDVGSASAGRPHQLPSGVRKFVNRREELERLDRVLAGNPAEPNVVGVSVLFGPAGVGKTSLALHWAHRVREHFPDGQLYADLRGYDPGTPLTPDQVLERFLIALGVPASEIASADVDARAGRYRSELFGRRVLVILDNAVTAAQVRPLVPGAAGNLVLVTSRRDLLGLAVRDGAHLIDIGVLDDDAAITLIRILTQERREDDDAEVAELTRLCARWPLALRIAGHRAALRPRMSLGELIASLRDESQLWDALSSGDEDDVDAVRTVFAWSYRALPADAARFFRHLGLHPGPDFTLPAIAALTATTLSEARRQLRVLLDTSLVEQHAPGRYLLHDLLRAYATDQAGREETEDTRRAALARVIDWYLHTAHAALLRLDPFGTPIPLDPAPTEITPLEFADRHEALAWFEAEQTSLAAAAQAADHAALDRTTWRLAAVLGMLYAKHNRFDDWFATNRLGLAAARRLGDRPAEAELLRGLTAACTQSHRLDEATTHALDLLAIRRELGDVHGEAVALNTLGLIALRRHDPRRAAPYFEQSLAGFRSLDDTLWEAVAAGNLAAVYTDLARLPEAEDLVRRTLAIFREHGDRYREGNALHDLGTLQHEQGHLDDALDTLQTAVDIARELDDPVPEGYWLLDLGSAQRALGRPGDALVSYQRSSVIHRQTRDRSREAQAWDGTGLAYQDLDLPDEAIPFHHQAAAAHQALDDHWHHALALDHLATALHTSGHPAEAQRRWREALTLLDQYADPRAQRLRQRIHTQLGNE